MPKIKGQYFNLKNTCILLCLLLLAACASIQAPQGGPRDTTPPKILNMTPKNQTRNFTAKKILIEFDEYFNIKDESKEFTISPELETTPILKKKKKKLEITLPDSLEENTTYTLNFGKSIADVNESNTVKNLSYVFSTGPEIDSLSISGKVDNALTGELEKDATVLILPVKRDTLFGKKRPSIYTTTDSSGNYKLSNLRAGEYKIYALKEGTSGDKIYQQINDEVGFIKNPIILNGDTTNINLQVFKEIATEFRVLDRKLNNDGSLSMIFNKSLKSPKITITDPKKIDDGKYIHFNPTNDTVRVWLTDLSFDSTKVEIQDDGKILQTLNITRGKKDTYTRDLKAEDNTNSNRLNPFKKYALTFNFPVTASDASKIILTEDSVKRTNFQLVKDSIDYLKYYIIYPWRNKRTYELTIGADAFTGIFNAKNKEFKKIFQLESTDSYSSLTLKVAVPDTTKSYIVEFINEKKVPIKSQVITKDTKIAFLQNPAGKYFVRVIYDENKNGIWDTGNLKEQTQPEKIWYSTMEMSLKPNWEREEVLTIPKPPAP